ncbi:hypothetical protein D3C72_1212630 [compost metagenome]
MVAIGVVIADGARLGDQHVDGDAGRRAVALVARAGRWRQLAAVELDHDEMAARGLRRHVRLERVVQCQRMGGQPVEPLQVGHREAALREMIGLEILAHCARQRGDRWQLESVQQLDPQVDMAVDVRPHRIAATQPGPTTSTHLGVAVH